MGFFSDVFSTIGDIVSAPLDVAGQVLGNIPVIGGTIKSAEKTAAGVFSAPWDALAGNTDAAKSELFGGLTGAARAAGAVANPVGAALSIIQGDQPGQTNPTVPAGGPARSQVVTSPAPASTGTSIQPIYMGDASGAASGGLSNSMIQILIFGGLGIAALMVLKKR